MNTYLTTRNAPYLLFPHRWLTQKPPDSSFYRSVSVSAMQPFF